MDSSTQTPQSQPELGWASQLVDRFLQGPLPLMVMVIALVVGAASLYVTPREEEPQIVVPLADVFVSAPGLSAQEVERTISTPLEKLLFQIDGVEYTYSMSSPGQSVVTVRFYVGEDREASLIKIYNKLMSNQDLVPETVRAWVVKPIEIDDVPIVVATLWSKNPQLYDDYALRRLAEEVELQLQSVPNTNRVTVVSGRPRQMHVRLNPQRLAAHQTSVLDIVFALQASNVQLPAGSFSQLDQVTLVEAGGVIKDLQDLRQLVVNVVDGIPVYLESVAELEDGPAEVDSYSWIGFGPAEQHAPQDELFPAVSVAVAKQKGANAVWVARQVEAKLQQLKLSLFPPEIDYRIIRNYGETADEKVNELVRGLGLAVFTVVIFIGVILGWRAALIIALSIPVCYGATLGVNLIAGYTINRVTLFALILSLGLLVDDPITNVENIVRYFSFSKFSRRVNILLAVQEVRGALIMSTIAIIFSFAPLFFITGMMGPYMAPMAFNVPLTVTMSTVVAFCVTPFLSYLFLNRQAIDQITSGAEEGQDFKDSYMYRTYSRLLRPLITSSFRSWLFLCGVAIMFGLALLLPALRLVPLKILPFDNKNEFQILVDLPEGSTLERTEALLRDFAHYLRTVPEVTDFTAFAGTSSPMDFNGMVRKYYLRQSPHTGDLRVNLVHKLNRQQQSHALLLRIRNDLQAISARYPDARIKLVEVPPGPPVMSTITAEIYGQPDTSYEDIQQGALAVAERLKREPLVVDVDTTVQFPQTKVVFDVDQEKAALSGVSREDIALTVLMALEGMSPTTIRNPYEVNPLPVNLRLPRKVRSNLSELEALYVKGRPGIVKLREQGRLSDAPQPMVQLGELGEFQETVVDQTIYHKNMERVAFVFAEVAGQAPADAILDTAADLGRTDTQSRPLAGRTYFRLGGGDAWQVPDGVRVHWTGEGEWQITLTVFRDLGLAFAAALIGIFLVLMLQTNSVMLSGVIMLAIPLSMIGIMPGFWGLNLLVGNPVGGYPNPVFFTATAMIGMIALAGIVVRNSVVLIEFIHQSLREGMDFSEALVSSGAVRTRPILLTAGTTLLGNIVITLDPIFSGLAWSIIFGIAASTVFTLGVVPVVYHLIYAHRPGHGLPVPKEDE